MVYKFKYKRRLFYRSIKVIGHRFEPTLDRMVIFLPDGSLKEIPKWSQCHVHLNKDYVDAQKKIMESQVGQAVPVNPTAPA